MGCCESRLAVPIINNSNTEIKEITENAEDSNLSQAGGHQGRLKLRDNRIFKKASSYEIRFYTELFNPNNTNQDLLELKKFIPKFYGLERIQDNSHIILENLLIGYENSNILDCKLGKVTWSKHHDQRRTEKRKKRAEETTSKVLGFRITGLVIRDDNGNIIEASSKYNGCYLIKEENVHHTLKKIVRYDQNRVKTFIKQTQDILDWFNKQRAKHFFTASIFYINGKNDCQTKLIDFSHVFDAEGSSDVSNI